MAKILLTAFTIFVLAILVKVRGNLLVGNATNSHLIYHEIHERLGILLIKRDKEIEIKASGDDVIAMVSVQNLKGDGESYIKRGGVGLKDVTIKIKSGRGKGYKFIIDVFAAAPNRPFLPVMGNMGYIEFEQWSNQSVFTEKSRLCSRLRGLTPGQKKICRRHKDHMPAISSGVKNGISECQFQFQGRRWNCTTVRDPTVFGPLTLIDLTPGQKICRRHKYHKPAISSGVKNGISECQFQFQGRRWNCTTVRDPTVFGPFTLIASRETAFTHAITSAGASLWIARACRAGRLTSCGCGRARPPAPLRKDWVWAGCGTDLHYSYRFTEGFIDIRERERKVKRGSHEQGRQLMNRHNNEAGRRAVIKLSRVTCKCHGVSGSCSLITCWQQLATIREIGDYLRDKYEGATEVKVSRRGRLRLSDPRYTLPTAQDLVYLEDSPDYCVRNDSLGSPGTAGRECNRTSAGTDGCSLMCCGRGYNTKRVTSKERCRCKFIWCCRVECDTCVSVRDVYTCK